MFSGHRLRKQKIFTLELCQYNKNIVRAVGAFDHTINAAIVSECTAGDEEFYKL